MNKIKISIKIKNLKRNKKSRAIKYTNQNKKFTGGIR